MIFAFQASDRGSNPGFAIIFFVVVVVFCLRLLFLFLFFFVFNRIDNPPTSVFWYKLQKAVDILYCV